MKLLLTKIQIQYGYRSNYDFLTAARDDIDKALGETMPKQRKSLRKDLEQKRQQVIAQSKKRKRHDLER